jgi:outer membrane cobalamin receptor
LALGLCGVISSVAWGEETRCIRREEELKYDKSLSGDEACLDPPVYYMGEVVVTGRRISNMEQASTSTVVEASEIEAHGDKTLDQVLDRIPGISTYTHTKGQTRLRMRGFDQDKVLLLVDGVPVSDVYATDVDIASVPVENISKIIVNRGVSSALYGTGGAMGTINVVSKKPARMFGSARSEYGSYGNTMINLAHGAPLGDFYYLLSGSIIHSQAFAPSRGLDGDKRRKWFDKLIRYDLYPAGDPFGDGPLNTFEDVTMPSKNQYLMDTGTWDHNDYTKYFVSAKTGYSFNRYIEAGLSSNLFFFQGRTNSYQMNAYSSYRGNRWKPRWMSWESVWRVSSPPPMRRFEGDAILRPSMRP